MNSENTQKLLTAYPLLYRELREQYFECGDGWFDLVWQVSAEIESAALLKGIPKTAEAWPSVRILKQKFGTLRIQLDKRISEQFEALVAKAYERSTQTCELCGAPAQLDHEHELGKWEEALCANCRKAHRLPTPPRDKTKLPVWMVEKGAYSTETGHSVHGKVDSRSVATRGLFFTPDLWV